MELLTVESRLWSEIGEFDLKKRRVVNVKLKRGGAGGTIVCSNGFYADISS